MTQPRVFISLLLLLAFISGVLSLSLGDFYTSLGDIFDVFFANTTPLIKQIIFELRLPRLISAFVAGSLLALAGALMQVLLCNPLADPYILGISSGASLGYLTALLLGISGYWVSGYALFGAVLTIFMVFMLASSQKEWTTTRLLLSGIIFSTGLGALINLILILSPSTHIHSMLFWLMGDLSYAPFPSLTLIILGIGFIICLGLAPALNILILGELRAKTLGIQTFRLQITLYFLSAIFTTTAVLLAGNIGFIGLIVPHILRLMGILNYRILLPGALLLGGTLLMLADTLARTILSPIQLPVGIFTTLLGVPLFLFFLYRGRI